MNSRKRTQLQERLKVLLADTLLYEMSDPRLRDVVVNRVELASDASYARVHVSSLTLNESMDPDVMRTLIRAAGHLRGRLSRKLGTRTVPELRFLEDQSVRDGERVLSLIRSLEGEKKQP